MRKREKQRYTILCVFFAALRCTQPQSFTCSPKNLQKGLGNNTFVPFVVINAFFFLFTFFVVPETKGRSIEEITRSFRQKVKGGRSTNYTGGNEGDNSDA